MNTPTKIGIAVAGATAVGLGIYALLRTDEPAEDKDAFASIDATTDDDDCEVVDSTEPMPNIVVESDTTAEPVENVFSTRPSVTQTCEQLFTTV